MAIGDRHGRANLCHGLRRSALTTGVCVAIAMQSIAGPAYANPGDEGATFESPPAGTEVAAEGAGETVPAEASEKAEDAAAPDDSELTAQERAIKLFEIGSAHYVNAEYEKALQAFLDAQTQYPSAEFQYNIGACYEQLEQYEAASRAYKTYLRNADNIADRANIENKIRRLDRLTAEAAARAELEAKQKAQQRALTLGQGGTPEPKKKQSPGKVLTTLGAVSLALGAAGGVTGVVYFGLVARSRAEAISELSEGDNPLELSLERARTIDAEGQRAEVVQWVLGSAGVALAAAGMTMLIIGQRKAKAAGPGRSARIAPVMSPRYGGVVVQGRF